MSDHTPGPWSAYSDDLWSIIVAGPNRVQVAGVNPVPQSEAPANARLIAAAPDLLEALIWCVNLAHGVGKAGDAPTAEEYEAAWDAGVAAIGKAEGE